jgi:hypothetical protein
MESYVEDIRAAHSAALAIYQETLRVEEASKANQRDGFGEAHHDGSGDFVVPALLLAVPSNPEEAEK